MKRNKYRIEAVTIGKYYKERRLASRMQQITTGS